jgi:superfamily II DNA or RNA helicase
LVLAFPISFKGKVIQYAGRILRTHPDKTAVTVYDYRDGHVQVLARMQSRRQKTLQGVGFNIDAHGGWAQPEQLGGSWQ